MVEGGPQAWVSDLKKEKASFESTVSTEVEPGRRPRG
jgi:hypothetical protein